MYVSQVNNNPPYYFQVQATKKLPGDKNISRGIANNYVSFSYPVSAISFQAKLLHKQPSKLERFRGCILGGAIGDAFGAEFEFFSLSKIKSIFGEKGAKFKELIGDKIISDFTDDTQMTCYTADGLIKSAIEKSSIKDINLACVYQSYKDWYNGQIKKPNVNNGWLNSYKSLQEIKAPGNTCINALVNDIPGSARRKINDSKGNGGVMRVAPVGLMYNKSPKKAFDIASACTLLTHSNPDAYLSAGAFSALIAYLVNGETLSNAIHEILKILKTKKYSNDVVQKIEQSVLFAKSKMNKEDAIEIIGRGNIGSEALAIAIYSSLKHPKDIKKAIELSANIGGDSDTVAAITGNILGTKLGVNKIPVEITNINDKKMLIELANDLYNATYNISKITRNYFSAHKKNHLSLKEVVKEPASPRVKYNKKLHDSFMTAQSIDIDNVQKYMQKTNMAVNISEKIEIPINLIRDELENKLTFSKLVKSIVDNCEILIENENKRYCWKDEKCSLEDLFWELYDITLNCKSKNDLYEILTIMSLSKEYSIKQMIDFLFENKYSNTEILNQIKQDLLRT